MRIQNKSYQETEMLGVGNGDELEVITRFADREAPSLVFAPGFGGSAEKYSLVEDLSNDFRVVSVSPRNFGRSTGRYTINNYISDLGYVVDDVSQFNGRRPYGIGHSLGGYTFAKLVEEGRQEEKSVEKLVLLDPLIAPTEQFPSAVNWYFLDCVEKNKVPLKSVIRLGNVPGFGFLKKFRIFGRSVFSEDDVKALINSLYTSESCNKPLSVPTQAILSGSTYLMIPKSEARLNELKQDWEKLGAEVELYPHLNHWFSGGLFTGVGDVFSSMEEEGMTDKIREFLNNN